MIHPTIGTNLYLSGPDLPPWDKENNWHYFERTEVLKKLEDTLLGSTAISQVFLVGPYKVGKTSTINYLLQKYINRNSHRDKHWKIIPVSQTERDTILNITVMWCEQYIENVMARANSDDAKWMGFSQLVNEINRSDWQERWDELTVRLPDDQRQLFDDLGRAIRAARSGDIQGWLRSFRQCLQKDTTNVMLVFLGNSELTLHSGQFPNERLGDNMVLVRILCEGREGYEGPNKETASKRPGSPGFEDQISSSEAKRLAQVQKIEIHAFTREEAKRFVKGEGIDPQFARVTFNIDTDEILDQVGYHPALLQIVCWWLVDDKDPSGFWDRRLEEITEHVSKLIDEKEKTTILHPERGISPNVFDRLRGKGVIL